MLIKCNELKLKLKHANFELNTKINDKNKLYINNSKLNQSQNYLMETKNTLINKYEEINKKLEIEMKDKDSLLKENFNLKL